MSQVDVKDTVLVSEWQLGGYELQRYRIHYSVSTGLTHFRHEVNYNTANTGDVIPWLAKNFKSNEYMLGPGSEIWFVERKHATVFKLKWG